MLVFQRDGSSKTGARTVTPLDTTKITTFLDERAFFEMSEDTRPLPDARRRTHDKASELEG